MIKEIRIKNNLEILKLSKKYLKIKLKHFKKLSKKLII